MERQFNKGDFEKLLKDNANQYRMYPSEKVWKGVNSALHSNRKWYGITVLALLIFTSTGLGLYFFNNKAGQTNIAVTKKPAAAIINNLSSPVTILKNSNSVNPVSEKRDNNYFKKSSQVLPVNIDLVKKSNAADFVAQNAVIIPVTEVVKEIIEKKYNDLETKAESVDSENGESNTSAVTNLQKENDENLISESSDEINADEFNKVKISQEELQEAINAIESQKAIIPVRKKTSKITTQFYFTPIVSYRTLTENKRSYSNGLYVNTQVVDLNDEVRHKPAIGLEFGIEGKYRLNESFFIKSGLQFNINRYDIRAFSHPTEIATVSVNRGFGTDILASPSNYRNTGGLYANWLENFYFQVAVPVGAEIILTERKKFSWGIGGTVQPTYVIGDRAYLISSDYKNYAKFPDLMRRWNLSTGIETFVGYSTGKIKWQVGPNLRYQHLSSFVSEYPVKENLFAIGLKVGATFNKK
jgi:hypothetical protein